MRQAALRAARASARAKARAVVPLRNPDFAHLDLEALRAFRRGLQEEEDRVSYWRRILQARLDTVQLGGPTSEVETRRVAGVLSHPRVQQGRDALVSVMPHSDVPPLPNLGRLWEASPAPGDVAARTSLATELVAAEAELSAYRTSLHRQLDAVTYELIARYREDPRLCLAALPLPD